MDVIPMNINRLKDLRDDHEYNQKEVAKIIIEVLDNPEDAEVLAQAKERVNNLVTKYPIK